MKISILLFLAFLTHSSWSSVCDVKQGSSNYALEFSCTLNDTKYEVHTHLKPSHNLACLKEISRKGGIVVSFRPIHPKRSENGYYYDFLDKSFFKTYAEVGGAIYKIDKDGDELCETQYPPLQNR